MELIIPVIAILLVVLTFVYLFFRAMKRQRVIDIRDREPTVHERLVAARERRSERLAIEAGSEQRYQQVRQSLWDTWDNEEESRRLDDEKLRIKEEEERRLYEEKLGFHETAEWKLLKQFATKYGFWPPKEGVTKLQNLLSSRGFDFSEEHLTDLILEAHGESTRETIENRVFQNELITFEDAIERYLHFYKCDDSVMFLCFQHALERRHLSLGSKNELLRQIERIQNLIELRQFEANLLDGSGGDPTIEKIDGFNGYEFAQLLSDLFARMGYSVEKTKLSGDQGADVVVVKFCEKTVIQAKRFQGNVGNFAVQEIMAAINLYKAQRGWL